MKNIKKEMVLAELIQKELDGCLTDQEFSLLQSMLKEDKEAVNYYVKTIRSISAFSANSVVPALESVEEKYLPVELLDCSIWKALADAEKCAPAVEITIPEDPKILIQKVQHQKVVRKISKTSLFSLITAAAAIILIFVFVHFAPPATGFKVAVLADSLNAKWADMDSKMEKGTPILTSREKLLLREGYAELLFDSDARVTIEGPAEFQILTDDQIKLQYGRLYAIVPQAAIGFTVTTQMAKVVDLGTEFGIESDARGDTYLHVIKGKTTLIGGEKSNKVSMEVDKGSAKKVSAETSAISNIPCNTTFFVREIDSKGGMVWRGQEEISLASIVVGLDGFQEVGLLTGIDPLTGELVRPNRDVYKKTNKAYNLVPQLKCIDGVFVPDGESGAIQITSMGHTFDCPDTSGIFSHEIAAYKGSIKNQHATIPPVTINGQEVVKEPILMLHSNIGITFDLQAIRESYPQLNIKSLKATGIPTTESKFPNFNFWILVDGQIKYEREIVAFSDNRGPLSFNVELRSQDRFLTLIVTDGFRATDAEKQNEPPAYANDFFYLIKPELCVADSMGR